MDANVRAATMEMPSPSRSTCGTARGGRACYATGDGNESGRD